MKTCSHRTKATTKAKTLKDRTTNIKGTYRSLWIDLKCALKRSFRVFKPCLHVTPAFASTSKLLLKFNIAWNGHAYADTQNGFWTHSWNLTQTQMLGVSITSCCHGTHSYSGMTEINKNFVLTIERYQFLKHLIVNFDQSKLIFNPAS